MKVVEIVVSMSDSFSQYNAERNLFGFSYFSKLNFFVYYINFFHCLLLFLLSTFS